MTVLPHRSSPSLTDAVNADFDRFCRRHGGRPAELLATISGRHPDDDVLRRLVADAPHDDVAARVLVQRLVPALVTIAARRSRRAGKDRRAIFDELLATAWMLVRTYPLERRPTRILANLVCDAEYETYTRQARRRWAVLEVPGLLVERAGADDEGHPGERVVRLLTEALRAGAPGDDVRLLARLHLGGETAEEVAAAVGCTSRTLRTRRRRAEARLAELAATGGLAA